MGRECARITAEVVSVVFCDYWLGKRVLYNKSDKKRNSVEENDRTPLIAYLRLIIGAIIFGAMGVVWVYDTHFQEWLFLIPAALMGVDPRDLINKKR